MSKIIYATFLIAVIALALSLTTFLTSSRFSPGNTIVNNMIGTANPKIEIGYFYQAQAYTDA
jgi:hypothetical protein